MKKYNIILIIGLIFFSFSLTTNQVNAVPEDVNYTFNENMLYNSSSITYDNIFNIKNKTEFTEIYNGTYSFTSEVDGTSGDAINFFDSVVETGTSCSIEVLSGLGGYDKIIEIKDVDSVDDIQGYNEFTPQASGTIEYWFRTNVVADNSYMRLRSEAIEGAYFFVSGDKFRYYDGASHEITDAVVDTWYHVRIDFECGAGSYLGLSADNFYISINGVQYGEFPFWVGTDTLNRINFGTYTGDDNYIFYIDAVGYSWDTNYNINNNIIPYNYINSSSQEIDRYEWIYNSTGDMYEYEPIDDPNGWTDTTSTAYIYHTANYENRELSFITYSTSSPWESKIHKDFNSANAGIYNITWSIKYLIDKMSLTDGEFETNIYSEDNTLRYQFIIGNDANGSSSLYYYNGASDIEIANNLNDNKTYEFKLCYGQNIGVLQLFEDSIYINEFIIPPLTLKEGLGKIEFISKSILTFGGSVIMNNINLDYVGVYYNGESLYNEGFAYATIDCNNPTAEYDKNIQNIVQINATGIFSLKIFDGNYSILTVQEEIKDFYNYTGLETINTYGDEMIGNGILDPKLLIAITGSNLLPTINNISIFGIEMTDGTNTIYPTYTGENIDNDKSYFYVENNNLKWNLTTNDDNEEYIQAEFSILQNTQQYILYLNHFISKAYTDTYTKFTYTDTTTTTFTMPTSNLDIGRQFTRERVINKMTIHISDNDNYNNGYIYGSINKIEFKYGYSTGSLVSTTFLGILPILFILIPIPIFMFYKFEKKPIVLIGTFFLMALIGTITSLIPIWLMFIIILGLIGLLATKRDLIKWFYKNFQAT